MSGHAAREPAEQGRIVGLLEIAFFGVVEIVEPDADDLRRAWQGIPDFHGTISSGTPTASEATINPRLSFKDRRLATVSPTVVAVILMIQK